MSAEAADSALKLYRSRFSAMGCSNEIVICGDFTEREAASVMELAAREVLRIEEKYSRYRSDGGSIVFRINQSAGQDQAVACDPETMDLLRTADSLYALSGGLFDITSGVLRRVWDFKAARVPPPEQISALLPLIGWCRVELENGSIRLPDHGMEIDFGGFGKEYAADRAAGILALHGVRHGYVNLGGDIRVAGPQPGGAPWVFGVADPRSAGAAVAQVSVISGGLSTSGDYEKYFEISGARYCHILNPKSGSPVRCWRSVSVTGVSSLAAGAMTTIAMLKESDAVPFLDRMKCNYLLISAAGQMITNDTPK